MDGLLSISPALPEQQPSNVTTDHLIVLETVVQLTHIQVQCSDLCCIFEMQRQCLVGGCISVADSDRVWLILGYEEHR